MIAPRGYAERLHRAGPRRRRIHRGHSPLRCEREPEGEHEQTGICRDRRALKRLLAPSFSGELTAATGQGQTPLHRSSRRKPTRSLRSPRILEALAVVAIGAAAGLGAAAVFDISQKLHESLQQAALTLIFGALLGGVIKLLLDDVQRDREARAEQTAFVAQLLTDLKTVYDRVERTRILLPAHRSALTYGNELRDLIDERVRLRNVGRGLAADAAELLTLSVGAMEDYLRELTNEFQWNYKRISDEQKVHEKTVDARLKQVGSGPPAARSRRCFRRRTARVQPAAHSERGAQENLPWEQIMALPHVKAFIGDWAAVRVGDVQAELPSAAEYGEEFEQPLDLASWLLRSELRRPEAIRRIDIPANLEPTATRLMERAKASKPEARR